MTEAFGTVVRRELDHAMSRLLPVRVDYDRFRPSSGKQITLALRNIGQRLIGSNSRVIRKRRERALESVLAQEAHFAPVYELLADEWSRAVFIRALLYRFAGPRHVTLIPDTEAYWKERDSIERRYLQRYEVDKVAGWTLNRYHMPGQSTTIAVEARPIDVHATFIRQQYAYRHGDVTIAVHDGDIVIDGGACWGDTALYFTDRVGPQGGVQAFEFVPANLTILRRNIAYNPMLQARARVTENALWETSGEVVQYNGAGPSSSANSKGTASVATLALDDWIERTGVLPTFIKLDIEGAEAHALRGTQRHIANHAPRLAVAVYHSLEDLTRLPLLIKELNPKYKLYLDHFTTYGEETVLFATAD